MDLGEGGFVLNARGVVLVVLFIVGAAGGWQIQTWRYERQLAGQARLHAETLKEMPSPHRRNSVARSTNATPWSGACKPTTKFTRGL